jgi:transcriptional regulator GlxA family with amidase domain
MTAGASFGRLEGGASRAPRVLYGSFRVRVVATERVRAQELIAQVAASAGVCDRSHLTRHFKLHVGTPGRYRHHAVT